MELTFLGTSSMVPTKERNVSGIYLSFKEEGILFDCGEGTQRQMNITGIKRTSVTRVYITHWHGDHVAGLIGLIQTLGNEHITRPIHIYGPKETKKRFQSMCDAFFFNEKIEVILHELDPKKPERCTDEEEFEVWAVGLEHSIPCIGFRFVEKDRVNLDKSKMAKLGLTEGPHLAKLKSGDSIEWKKKKISPDDVCITTPGKVIVYIPDTLYCKAAIELARDADVLIAESTYTAALQEKALEYSHMTARESAQIASQAGVKKLYLTHFSQRYKTTEEIEQDARTVFDNVVCAKDFMKVRVE